MKEMKEIIHSRQFRIAAIVLGSLVVILVSFVAGFQLGLHKAKFSYAFGANYEKNFVGRGANDGRHMMPPMMNGGGSGGFRNGHGIAGQVVSVSDDTIVIKDRNNQESAIKVSATTVINQGQNTVALSDIKPDERIVVIGQPGDDGTVQASLIRVFDATSAPAASN